MIVLLAGTLLLTPGVLSDITGIVALMPPVRRRLRRFLLAKARRANPESLWALLLTDDEPVASASTWTGAPRPAPQRPDPTR